jgi:excisionase family DNA binding protein
MSKLLKIKDAAEQLGVCRMTILRMRLAGRIRGVQLSENSRLWRIPQSEIDRVLTDFKQELRVEPIRKPKPKLMPKAQRIALAEAAASAAAV